MDVLLSVCFRAQRSVEIYCLTGLAGSVPFAVGFVHPDIEADYLQGFDSRGVRFTSELQQSWGAVVDITETQSAYSRYFDSGDLVSETLRLSFPDPQILTHLRESRMLPFTVGLDQLPDNISEAKALGVSVALTGGPALTSCIVTHNGIYSVKKRDGSVVPQHLRRHSTVVTASSQPLEQGDTSFRDPITSPPSLSFWGRGIAGSWTLSIQEDDDNPVDLSSVTEVQVWISYQGFLS